MRVFLALFIMFSLPLVFWWLPIPGLAGLVGGLVGGFLIGTAGRSFLLALVPFVLLAMVVAAIGFGVGFPLVGSVLAGIALIWLMVNNVLLLFGALIGGLLRSVTKGRSLIGPRLS